MVTERDQTLGGEHTMQCTDDILQNCTLETYVMLLTNVTTKNLILKSIYSRYLPSISNSISLKK